jgi:hypothetical protein
MELVSIYENDKGMVGDVGVEPTTSSVSTKRSTAELTALSAGIIGAACGYRQGAAWRAACRETAITETTISRAPPHCSTVSDS